jgi:alpha-aminoadipic semialdehyde synthase
MTPCIGIRREDEKLRERRTPLTPEQVQTLAQDHAIEVCVQPSDIRIIPQQKFAEAGAKIVEDLSPCPIIFGLKEIPLDELEPSKVYIFFSHVIKGQSHNMEMLRKLLELNCTLIDYERVTDDQERRLIFFGRHAGLAGMIETLWALGKRLSWEGIPNPFDKIRRAIGYPDLPTAKAKIAKAGRKLATRGLPESLAPIIFGFTGYGHVSQGAQEIFNLLPFQEIDPSEIDTIAKGPERFTDVIYKVVFKEEHLVEPLNSSVQFELQDYYQHPEKYRSQFASYLPHLTVLLNCIYWDERYPRLLTKQDVQHLYGQGNQPRLRVIGDISCDVEGAIECNVRFTTSENPIYVYEPSTGQTPDGWEGQGPVVLAVFNLPSELPLESSRDFGRVLLPFVPQLVGADFSVDFEHCQLPLAIKKAVIVYKGELTPKYRYLEKYLEKVDRGVRDEGKGLG